jgi:beta-lactamase class A
LFVPLRSWRLQLAAAAAAVIVAILSAQSFASAREGATSYVIQPGDTLSLIAATTGLSIDKLSSLNGLSNPNFIVAGRTLSLDGSTTADSRGATTSAASTGATARYTVKSGDTLWAISQANGVSVDAIVQLNNLANADALSIGEVLQLPASAAHASSIQSGAGAANATTAPSGRAGAAPATITAGLLKPAAGGGQGAGQTAAQTTVPLVQRIASAVAQVGQPNLHVGVSASNLVTGERLNFHGDDVFPSASTMKLPILVELERQIAAGSLSWTESLRAEAGAMIAVSDNNAADDIATTVKLQSVTDTMGKLGLGGTRLLNFFDDSRGPLNKGQNQTTPSNMSRLLELIATDQIVSSQVSADIRSLLAGNADRSKLARLLPADARVAHKSGWYDGVANDVGIVTVDRVPTRWVIAVFTENVPDAETGNQLVATISRAVYDAWAP